MEKDIEVLSNLESDKPPKFDDTLMAPYDREYIRHRLGVLSGSLSGGLEGNNKFFEALSERAVITLNFPCQSIFNELAKPTEEIFDYFLEQLVRLVKLGVECALENANRSPDKARIRVSGEYNKAKPFMATVTLRIVD